MARYYFKPRYAQMYVNICGCIHRLVRLYFDFCACLLRILCIEFCNYRWENSLYEYLHRCSMIIYVCMTTSVIVFFLFRAFKIIINMWFQRLLYAVIIVHSGLVFIEPPSVNV